MTREKLTYHAREERVERIARILMTIGIGNVVIEKEMTDRAIGQLTDTGVLIIRNKKDNAIVTMYVCDMNKATWMFEGQLPRGLKNTIRKNHAKKLN